MITGQNQLRQAQTSYARARYTYIVSVPSLEAASGTLSMEAEGQRLAQVTAGVRRPWAAFALRAPRGR